MLIIGLALAVDAGFNHLRLSGEMDDMQRERGFQKNARPLAREPVSEQTQRELDAARHLLQELTLPWEELFRSIDAAVDRDTALLAIEPDAGKGAVRIVGEARDYLSILNFIVRLEAGQALTRIHLLNHEIREEIPERPYLFTLAANWKATP